MIKPPFNLKFTMRGMGRNRGALFGSILLLALVAFEIFNYTTTDFALTDLLGGNLMFMGLRWATILSIAFCAIDFAGVARLFTPEQGQDEPAEIWYLFGAWMLAAAMNAILTWWGVSVAINSHTAQGSAIVGRDVVSNVVPVFVAVMVWLIRILIIGSFAMGGERLFSIDLAKLQGRPATGNYASQRSTSVVRSAPRPMARPEPSTPLRNRTEPSYQPLNMAAKSRDKEGVTWR
jgi:hypothetical protein